MKTYKFYISLIAFILFVGSFFLFWNRFDFGKILVVLGLFVTALGFFFSAKNSK